MRFPIPHLAILAATLVQVAACAHTAPTGAGDIVVAGYVEGVSDEVLDELGMNVLFTGRLRVTRVLRGTPPSSPLTIRYIAHTPYASDRVLKLRLRPWGDDAWVVCQPPGGRGYICR
jgi:hypothetical protein